MIGSVFAVAAMLGVGNPGGERMPAEPVETRSRTWIRKPGTKKPKETKEDARKRKKAERQRRKAGRR